MICNDFLDLDHITRARVNLGELAHVVGRKHSPRSPRGQDPLPTADRNLHDNLILLCPRHHSLIDKPSFIEEYPVERLRALKREHEKRIHYLTGLATDRETVIVKIVGDVRGTPPELTDIDARDAVLQSGRYPAAPDGYLQHHVGVDLRGLPGEGDAAYFDEARQRIQRELIDHLHRGIERGVIRHVSVFGFARIPLLALVGDALDDKVERDIYQRHTGSEPAWAWPAASDVVEFETRLERAAEHPDAEVALLLSVSGTVDVNDLPEALQACAIYVLTPVGAAPSRDLVRSHETVGAFAHALRAALALFESAHPGVSAIAVVPAIPLSLAIELGAAPTRGVHPPLRIYDRNDSTYTLALEVNA